MSPRPKVSLDLPTILEAAGELADETGMQEVTLANLAKKLGIRPPSLYNHFEGLPGLRKQLAIYGLNKLYKDLADAAIGVSGTEALLVVSQAYVGFARRHPGVYEATLTAPDPEDVEVQQAGGKIVELSVRLLSAFALEGEAAIHTVRGLRSILHGFASLEQRGGFKISLNLDQSLQFTLLAFLNGVAREGGVGLVPDTNVL